MKLGFDQSVAFLQNKSRSFWTHYSSDTLYGREGVFIGYRIEISSNFVDTMKNDDENDDYNRALLSWYLGLVVNGCIVRDESL